MIIAIAAHIKIKRCNWSEFLESNSAFNLLLHIDRATKGRWNHDTWQCLMVERCLLSQNH